MIPEDVRSVLDNPAGFKSWMHDRVVNAIRRTFGEAREFAFRIEVTRAGRPHLHGVADVDVQERIRLRDALELAGGRGYVPESKGDHQADVRDLFSADGWARYTEKDEARTKAAMGIGSTLSVTRGCRARAEALWEASR